MVKGATVHQVQTGVALAASQLELFRQGVRQGYCCQEGRLVHPNGEAHSDATAHQLRTEFVPVISKELSDNSPNEAADGIIIFVFGGPLQMDKARSYRSSWSYLCFNYPGILWYSPEVQGMIYGHDHCQHPFDSILGDVDIYCHF
jgi:hypothetical protein